MFVDAKNFGPDDTERAQICIFGSGPAGMTLAHDLSRRGISVMLVEAGAIDYTDWSQDLYRGDVIGDTYYDLSSARLRMFGGTSNHWGGHCIPLDAHDFEPNPAFPKTGWPIKKSDLEPYLDAACDILEIPNDFGITPLTEFVRKTTFQYSPPVLFGEKYMEYCETSPNIRVFLETALTNLTPEGNAISRAQVKTNGGGLWSVEAETFILCLGGIENPRMLLWLDTQYNGALDGNRNILGSYWMEHPYANLGEALLWNPGENFFHEGEASFALSRDAQFQAGLLNAGLQMDENAYTGIGKALTAELLCLAPGLGSKLMEQANRELVCGSRIVSLWEQAPVRQNRVTLTQEVDALGIPQVALHWRRGEDARRTIIETMRIFADELARSNRGRVRLASWIRDNAPIPTDGTLAGWHHMGGTRMNDSPSHGVVDRNLRVHGLDNLFVAGSSVFPSGGYANPTLTIVQMALRLAEHLAKRQSALQ